MSYISLNATAGLESPNEYGAGVQFAWGLKENFPFSSLQIGVYLVDQCKDIVLGKLDSNIENLVKFAQKIAPSNIYLRIGYEFDYPDNRYDPAEYVEAYKYTVDKFRASAVSNVAFVWHSSTPTETTDKSWFMPWFPGEDYVDWCGISVFEQPYSCQVPTNCFIDSIESFSTFCNSKNFKMMIAESTPFGGILDESGTSGSLDTSMIRRALLNLRGKSDFSLDETLMQHKGNLCGKRPYSYQYNDGEDQSNSQQLNEAGISGSTWSRWFIPILSFIERYDIRIWSYINNDWDSFDMWRVNHGAGVYWGDSRIQCKMPNSTFYYNCTYFTFNAFVFI